MSFIDDVKDYTFGHASTTVVLEEGVELPPIGFKHNHCGTEAIVVGVDEESRKVDLLISRNLSKDDVLEVVREKLTAGIDEVAHLLYLWDNNEKPSSLILWMDVPDEMKDPYIQMATKIVHILAKNDLCFVEPGDL